jgi:transposase
MQSNTIFIGVDVSKHTLDVAVHGSRDHCRVTNDSDGFKKLRAYLKVSGIEAHNCWFVLEHTGGYEYRFIQFCFSRSLRFTRVPGLEVKRSLGLQRGKNDKIDARRLATYGSEKRERLCAEKPSSPAIDRMRRLLRERSNYVKHQKALAVSLSETSFMRGMKATDSIAKRTNKIVNEIERCIAQVEAELHALVAEHEALCRNFELLTSITGIGDVNAWTTLAYTQNFAHFANGRKYAAYCGLAPYEHSSGLFKGKGRTSSIANHEIKALLNNAAKSAIQWEPELNAYYKRREAMGKHHLSIMNEVMFKLVLRMFAVVKNGTHYVKKPITNHLNLAISES